MSVKWVPQNGVMFLPGHRRFLPESHLVPQRPRLGAGAMELLIDLIDLIGDDG